MADQKPIVFVADAEASLDQSLMARLADGRLDLVKMMEPADIAETYRHMTQQPIPTWTHGRDPHPASEGL